MLKAGLQSVWAPACQDQFPGGHAGVGVISLHGAPLCAPSLVTPEFPEFFLVEEDHEGYGSYWYWLRGALVCC